MMERILAGIVVLALLGGMAVSLIAAMIGDRSR